MLIENARKTRNFHLTTSLTWWFWRGGCTRSHSELGRETPQRRWYSVLRRGRVGRCQVCKVVRRNKFIRTHSCAAPLFKRISKRPAFHEAGRFLLRPSRRLQKSDLGKRDSIGFSGNLFELEQVENIRFDQRASVRPIGSVRAGLGGN